MDIADSQREADWNDALDDYRGGMPGALARMMREHPIPSRVALVLADAIENMRKPRNADKRKLTPTAERRARAEVTRELRWLERARQEADDISNELGDLTTQEVRQRLSRLREDVLKILAAKYGVGVEAIRKLRTKAIKPQHR